MTALELSIRLCRTEEDFAGVRSFLQQVVSHDSIELYETFMTLANLYENHRNVQMLEHYLRDLWFSMRLAASI